MEEMQVTAAALLKVSEDDLLHVFEKRGGVLQKCVACEGHSEKRKLLYLPKYKASMFFS